MRCHFGDTDNDGETNPPAYNIWTSGTLQTPNILKSILNPNVQDQSFISEDLSNLCSLDVASPSQKRKIDCEREDIEERFFKVQRKKQLQKVAARANLIVDDQDDSDEEERMYQQMKWIEKENATNFYSDESDSFIDNQQVNSSIVRLPKLKWKDERRRLLRISMAKIQGVEDPEAYLRRSVLINNTVKRLQKDVAMVNRYCSSVSNSYFQGNAPIQDDDVINSWESRDFKLENAGIGFHNDFENDLKKHSPEYSDVSTLKFHLACTTFSTGQSLDVSQSDPNDPTYCSSPYEEQKPNAPLPSLVIKPPSGLHVFASQPCGLQYRNPMHSEDCVDEYHESPSSSILDSVVYHSLVTSLET